MLGEEFDRNVEQLGPTLFRRQSHRVQRLDFSGIS